MYRSKNSTALIRFIIFSTLTGGSIFWQGLSWSPAKQIENSIDLRNTKNQERVANRYLKNDSINTNLFTTSLQEQKTKKSGPLASALQQTQAQILSQYQCNMSLPEISTILLYTNTTFRFHYIEQITLDNKELEKNYPSQDNIRAACKKFNACLKPSNITIQNTTNLCETTINTYFTQALQTDQEVTSLEEASLAENKYQNGDTEDSDFDILFDIAQVGKILFESFKAQPKIIYYQMPNFNARDESGKPIEKQNEAQKTNITDTPQNSTTPQTPDQLQYNNTRSNQQNPEQDKNFSSTEDEEINVFLNKKEGQSAYGNKDTLLFHNQCIILPEESQENTIETSPSTSFSPYTYAKNNEDVTAEQNKNLQNISTSNTIASSMTSENKTNTRGDDDRGLSDEDKKNITNCLNKCDARDQNGDYYYPFDERQVCKLQCICGDIVSPALPNKREDSMLTPLLKDGALRIRFCTVPSQVTIPNTNQKKISSISEIISAIQTSTKALYNSGKLSVKVQATEVLQGSNSPKEDTSKNTSFIIQTSKKNNPANLTENDIQNNNKDFLNKQKQASTFEKNEFTLLAQTTASNNKSQNIQSQSVPSSPVSTTLQTNNHEATDEVKLLLTREQQGKTNSTIYEFISLNKKFLQDLNQLLHETDTILKSFKK